MKTVKSIISTVVITIFLCNCYGQLPKSVTIGKQIWMVENLNVDTFRNGDHIMEARSWQEFVDAGWDEKPAYIYLYNDPRNGNKYGKIYNWFTVNDKRCLAPEGWHVPSDLEWTVLTDFLGGEEVAGMQMKNTSGWINNGNGDNRSVFSGLPGGLVFQECRGRESDAGFFGINEIGLWWSSTENDAGFLGKYTAWARTLTYEHIKVNRIHYCKLAGLYVRCIKN